MNTYKILWFVQFDKIDHIWGIANLAYKLVLAGTGLNRSFRRWVGTPCLSVSVLETQFWNLWFFRQSQVNFSKACVLWSFILLMSASLRAHKKDWYHSANTKNRPVLQTDSSLALSWAVFWVLNAGLSNLKQLVLVL